MAQKNPSFRTPDHGQTGLPAQLPVTTVSDFRFSYSQTSVPEQTALHHYHDACEIVYYIKADLQVFIKDTRYEIRGGDLIFMDEYDLHHIEYRPIAHYERYVVNFRRSWIAPVLAAFGEDGLLDSIARSPTRHVRLSIRDRVELQHLLDHMHKACTFGHEPADSQARIEVRANLVLVLLHVRRLLLADNTRTQLGKNDKLVQDVVQHLDKRYGETIRLDQLAAEFFVDKFYLSHLFKRQTGFSIMEYVQHRRVIEAQKKLIETHDSMIDIYLDCGFSNAQHFHRMFKRLSGTTPSQYRRQYTRIKTRDGAEQAQSGKES